MKLVDLRTMRKILKNAGYVHTRTKGSHEMWSKNGNTISVPSVSLNPMIARRLIKENNLTEYLTD